MSSIIGPNEDPNLAYFLLRDGVKSVAFNKQTAPPLAPVNKGILYELTDGKLYYNGSEVLTTSSPNPAVFGPSVSVVDALARWDNTTGTLLDNSNVFLGDDRLFTNVAGVRLSLEDANPGNDSTLWYSTSGKFNFGPVSLSPCCASCFYTNFTTGTDVVLPPNIITQLAPVTSARVGYGFSQISSGKLSLTAPGCYLKITASLSFLDLSAPTEPMDFYLYINDVIDVSGGAQLTTSNNTAYSVCFSIVVPLNTGGTIDLRAKSPAGGTIRIKSFNISCVGIVS